MRTLCCAVCGGLGMLFCAGLALADENDAASSAAADPVTSAETSVIDMNEIDRVDECIDAQVCIDRYLWSLYERTRKVDTVRVPEQIKVAVKRTIRKKRKVRTVTETVTRTISKYVVEDFGWKDPDAAKKFGMTPQDYVIGGMDRTFRVTLYHALRALDNAGLMPGITSAFRDDYRQTIATGMKARSDRSFHGGSFRGGYGHGLAADIVSVKGVTRAERMASSGVMWKWVDDHEQELGIGRPYRDRDAPHVGPLDGQEYFAHRIEPKLRLAEKAQQAEKEKTEKAAQEAEKEKKATVEKTEKPAEQMQPARKQAEAAHKASRSAAKDSAKTKNSTVRSRLAETAHRGGKAHQADAKVKGRQRLALRAERTGSKRAKALRPGKARAQSRATHST